jgi:ABC-type uncharacterized transport system ATPase subunit
MSSPNPTASPTALNNGSANKGAEAARRTIERAAPPPNPKVQAVTFALELAKIRAAAGVAGEKQTEVTRLLADAKEIADFLGPTTTASAPRREAPIPTATDTGGSMVRMSARAGAWADQ